MALGDGTGWDETHPVGTDSAKDGDDEIRDVRKGIRIRLEKEHTTLGSSSAGGEHKAGSAMAYYQSAAPTNRPDGSTALTSADAGREFIDSDDQIHYHLNASAAWVATKTALTSATAGVVSASKAVIVGTNKEIDTIVIAEGGLKIGAGAGTAVTSSAAELNKVDGFTGTAANLNTLTGGATSNAASLHRHEGHISDFTQVTADTETDFAHSLGAVPSQVIVMVGDSATPTVVYCPAMLDTNNNGVSIRADSTNVKIRWSTWTTRAWTGAAYASVTSNYFKVFVRA